MKYLLLLCFFLTMKPLVYAQPAQSFPQQCVQHYAKRYGIPPELIEALIDIESDWNSRAISSAGAMGLMQLMPRTALRFGAMSPFDIEQNIAAGTRYVTTLMWEFHGDLRLVTAAYYAGDLYVGMRQLNYSNPEVVAYVRAVRLRYLARKSQHSNSNQEAKR